MICGLIAEGTQLHAHAVRCAVIWCQSVMKWRARREFEWSNDGLGFGSMIAVKSLKVHSGWYLTNSTFNLIF